MIDLRELQTHLRDEINEAEIRQAKLMKEAEPIAEILGGWRAVLEVCNRVLETDGIHVPHMLDREAAARITTAERSTDFGPTAAGWLR